MTKNQERHIIASVGTAIFMLIVFLLLWFIYLTAVVPEEEEPQPAIRPAAKIQVSNKAIFLFIKCCTPL